MEIIQTIRVAKDEKILIEHPEFTVEIHGGPKGHLKACGDSLGVITIKSPYDIVGIEGDEHKVVYDINLPFPQPNPT